MISTIFLLSSKAIANSPFLNLEKRDVTGTGCTATVIIGTFLTACPNFLEAASTGLSYFGLAGEKAAAKATGPGTFQIALLDALYGMNEEELRTGAKIKV